MRCSLTKSSFRCSLSRSRQSNCSSLVTRSWCCPTISARSCSAGGTLRSGSSVTAMRGVSHEGTPSPPPSRKESCGKNLPRYTDHCGSHVRSGRRQSMPSSSTDNCARVRETVPLVACGHTKRPRSSRFANKPPSYQRTLIRSPDATTCCIQIEQSCNRISLAPVLWKGTAAGSQDRKTPQADVLR
jgi:hypothetical protein